MTRSSSRRARRAQQRTPIAVAIAPPSSSARALPVVATIGLSAFLLFSLELLTGRLVLPTFGGTPGVWATTLCFFTLVLFLGYLYAHLVATRLSAFGGGVLQVALAVVAIVLALVGPTDIASFRNPGLPEALNVLVVVALIAGAAGFLLATTTPLLSAWFGGRGSDPWWLYAVSNGASFAALLAYPFLVEPFIALSTQRLLIVLGLVVYAVLVGVIVRGSRAAPTRAASEEPTAAEIISRRRQVLWLVAAIVPAGLLTATTNFLQTDLVAAPFIWIGPLAIYLASFVVAFSERGRRALPAIQRLVPAAATLMWIPFVHPSGWPAIAILVVELGTLFIIAVAIHGRLAIDRPGVGQLTRFYLVLSAGGVVATAFVAVVAPVVFNDIFEYPILLVLGVVVLALLEGRGAAWLPSLRSGRRAALVALLWRLAPYLAFSAVVYLFFSALGAMGSLLVIGGVAVALSLTPRIAAIAAPVAIVVATLINATDPSLSRQLVQVRDFFGVIQVITSGNLNVEYSGTTLHGLQFTDDKRNSPTSYYAQAGPLGSVFDDLRKHKQGASIGVVGLGAGTIAAYAQKGDQLTFFEIDPNATRIAFDPAYFTYLRDAAVTPRIVDGDGRLSLEATPAGSFDLLILDAFSSDAVPPHLLTKEAISSYVRTLRPGGLLAFNVSNRYYDLAFTLGATARVIGLDVAGEEFHNDQQSIRQQGAANSIWVVIGDHADIARFRAGGWSSIVPGGPVLTDDYPDLTRVLRIFNR